MNLLIHILALDDMSGRWYAFWSGVGGDIGEAAILGALLSNVRKHNCHVRGCWRIGRHPVAGTEFVVCRRHHPNGAPSHSEVLRAAAR